VLEFQKDVQKDTTEEEENALKENSDVEKDTSEEEENVSKEKEH